MSVRIRHHVNPLRAKLQRIAPGPLDGRVRMTGPATLGAHRLALGVMDFSFLGGSMGSVVGEKLTRLIEAGPAPDPPTNQPVAPPIPAPFPGAAPGPGEQLPPPPLAPAAL